MFQRNFLSSRRDLNYLRPYLQSTCLAGRCLAISGFALSLIHHSNIEAL
jgi:hypothetical protein